jgi:hypothetical protein
MARVRGRDRFDEEGLAGLVRQVAGDGDDDDLAGGVRGKVRVPETAV